MDFCDPDINGQLRMNMEGDYEVIVIDDENQVRAELLLTDTHDMWEG